MKMTGKVCPSCGTVLPAKANFCFHCGKALHEENDGTVNDPESKAFDSQMVNYITLPKKDVLKVMNSQPGTDYIRFLVHESRGHSVYDVVGGESTTYQLQPVIDQEISHIVDSVLVELQNNLSSPVSMSTDIQREYFMRIMAIQAKKPKPEIDMSIPRLNKNYSLNLREGLFCFMYLHIDSDENRNKLTIEKRNLLRGLRQYMEETIQPLCYDLIPLYSDTSIKIFMNYADDNQKAIDDAVQTLMDTELSTLEGREYHLTVCIGDVVSSSWDIPKAENTAWATLYSRMYFGTDQIIRYMRVPHVAISEKEENWTRRIENAWSVLDKDGLHRVFDEMFLQPNEFKSSYEFALFVRNVADMIQKCKSEFLAKIGGTADIMELYANRSQLKKCTTFREYRDELIKICVRDMEHFEEAINSRNLQPIRIARDYVADHCGEMIKLNDVADAVGLSPSYFSNLFAKKTGENFSDYVTRIKMEKACDYLREGNKSIKEIAASLGFPDARYFSKIFKAKTGVKPTEYKKIYV